MIILLPLRARTFLCCALVLLQHQYAGKEKGERTMRPGRTPSNYFDTTFPSREANIQYPTQLRDRGNVDKTDPFKLLEDLLQFGESTLFRFQETIEHLSSSTIRIQPGQNGVTVKIDHTEIRRHSTTIFVPNTKELPDTLNQAARSWYRASDKGRF